jgi:hypothetical protein
MPRTAMETYQPRLSISSAAGYHHGMQHNMKKHPQTLMVTALAGGGLILLLAAFLGWIVQGPEIFLAMAENGLSWCF